MAAQAVIGNDCATVFHAIGPLDHQRDRHIQRGHSLTVAHQRCDLHRLARAIDAAFRIHKGVKGGGHCSAGNSAITQIECRRLEAQKGIVAIPVGCDQHGGRKCPLSARKPRLELDVPVLPGTLAGQHLVAAGEEPNFDRVLTLSARERMHEGVDAVIARERREAEVRNDEPLRRQRVELLAGRASWLRYHHIDARSEASDGLVDGKGGCDVGIKRLLDAHLAFPNLRGALLSETTYVVAVERALKIAPHYRVEQIAIADPVNLKHHLGCIDAHHRNPALAATRQHVSLAHKVDCRLAVADVDVELGRFGQRLLHHRRDSGAQRDGIALTMLETLDAELSLLRGDGRLVDTCDRYKGREIHPFGRKILG